MRAASLALPILLTLLVSPFAQAGGKQPTDCWEPDTKASPDDVLCWFKSGVSNETKSLGHKRRNPDDENKSECASKNSAGGTSANGEYHWLNITMDTAEQGSDTVIFGRDVDDFISGIDYCQHIEGRPEKPESAETSSASASDRVCSHTEYLPENIQLTKFGFFDDNNRCTEKGLELVGAKYYFNITTRQMARGYWKNTGDCRWTGKSRGTRQPNEKACQEQTEIELNEIACYDGEWCNGGNEQTGDCGDKMHPNRCFKNLVIPKK